MPAMTPGASPPADYPQQLFSHLQAWRHHLEQAIATPQTPQAPMPTAPAGGGSEQAEPAPPDQPGSRDDTSSGSQSTKIDPDEYLQQPEYGYGSGINELVREQISNVRQQGPENRYASADLPVNTAFGQKLRNIAADTTPPMTTRSLYFNRGAEQSMTGPSTGPDVRFAAPPPASQWWKASQGLASRVGDRVRAEDIIDVPPIQ
jgi:hypothetical protein